MAGLSKPLAALDQHLKVQNRERLTSGRTLAPMAPESKDPTLCRWCQGTLRELLTPGVKDYCERGCSTEALTRGDCADCGREFMTGLPLMNATLCWTCAFVDRRSHEEAHTDTERPTYRFSRFRRGGYR